MAFLILQHLEILVYLLYHMHLHAAVCNFCLQTDLEEAKAQEIIKLQNSLQAMKSKIDETNALLIKEREAARKAIEEAPPIIKETQVFVEDTKKIESLTEEINSLKVTCSDLLSLTWLAFLFLGIYFIIKVEFYLPSDSQHLWNLILERIN